MIGTLAVMALIVVLVLFLMGRANHPTEAWYQTMGISIGLVAIGLTGCVGFFVIFGSTIRILTGHY